MAEKGKINKDQYVRTVEEIEYRNVVNAAYLLNRGFKEGFFPYDSKIPHFHNFEDHYKLQQLFGHSQWLAEQYDLITPQRKGTAFNGTILMPETLTDNDREQVVRYLVIKDGLYGETPAEVSMYAEQLQVELHCLTSQPKDSKQQQLLKIAFNKGTSRPSLS